MSTVTAKLKWGKKQFDIEIDTSGTVEEFKAMILSLTGVPVNRQKLMAKGVWKGTLKDSADFSSFTFKAKQKIMLMGKAAEVPKAKREEVVFIEDMSTKEAAKAGAVIPAGFKNLGNTCYMNSTLQCIRAVPEIRAALTSFAGSAGGAGGAGAGMNGQLARTLAADFDGVDGEAESYPPIRFVMALRQAFPQFDEVDPASRVHKQQDADELFNSVMMALASNLNKPVDGVTTTDLSRAGNVIDALFQVRFENTLKCTETATEPPVHSKESARKLRCNIAGGAGSSVQINHLFEGIKLGLDGTVEKRSEILDRNAVWSKQQRISRLPKYLCVQFMRFYWKPTPDSRDRAGVNCKMMRPVAFPANNLDVYDFCTPAVQAKLKVYRDKYADEALGGGKKEETTKAAAAAATAAEDTDMTGAGADGDDDDDDLAAALALSLAGGDGDGDVKMEEDDGDLLGPGIPDEFRGMYELFAVVSHKGRSASSGHYMGWVRAEGDNWYCFDDDAVSPCKTEHITALKGGGDWDMAYIVFYRAKQ